MPARASEIRSKVDAGENKVDATPPMRAERDAISRSAIYAISLEVA